MPHWLQHLCPTKSTDHRLLLITHPELEYWATKFEVGYVRELEVLLMANLLTRSSKIRIHGLVCILVLISFASCARPAQLQTRETPPPSSARETCEKVMEQARVYGPVSSFRAENASASQVVKWQEGRHGSEGPRAISPFRNRPDEDMSVCLFSGDFQAAIGPSEESTPAADQGRYDRLILVVEEDGEVHLDSLYRSGTVEFELPSEYGS